MIIRSVEPVLPCTLSMGCAEMAGCICSPYPIIKLRTGDVNYLKFKGIRFRCSFESNSSLGDWLSSRGLGGHTQPPNINTKRSLFVR
jgi:hypothetical protein